MSILEEFETAFKAMRDELGFSSTLDELDSIFYLRDFILQQNYISTQLDRMICNRMRDTFHNWNGGMHQWVMPLPHWMPSVEEAKAFSEDEQQQIIETMKKFSGHIAENTAIGLVRDKKKEGEWIDKSVELWKECLPELHGYAQQIVDHWKS